MPGRMLSAVALLILPISTIWSVNIAAAMRLHRPWSDLHACELIESPHWPHAYAKTPTETQETKGRIASSLQNLGHTCAVRGTQSKCNRCEPFTCESNSPDQICEYQLQGMDWSELPKNAATLSDTPWAIGAEYRNDIGGADTSHVCLIISTGQCLRPFESIDYKTCRIRCWGHNAAVSLPADTPRFLPSVLVSQDPDPMLGRKDTVAWKESNIDRFPQGFSGLVAGTAGESGHRDGLVSQALFRSPKAVAVDADGNVFVADTDNHCIRMIKVATAEGAEREVITLAGVPGQHGYQDGEAATATFDNPSGITLYYDWTHATDLSGESVSEANGNLVLIVADTANNRIRKIVVPDTTNTTETVVSTLAGRQGMEPQAGFSDGSPIDALFTLPQGVDADHDGTVFVADTGNHLVRRVGVDGYVYTLAGNLVSADEGTFCPPPCLKGQSGFRDGNRSHAQFSFPSDVSIEPLGTVLVTDGHRIRRVTRNGTSVTIQGVTSSNRVMTVAGQEIHGRADGSSEEATFNSPWGVAVTSDGRMYASDTSNCRLRRITSAVQLAITVSCSTSAHDIIIPSGCTSYDDPLDGTDLTISDAKGHVHYNHISEAPNKFGYRIQRCQGVPPPQHGMTSDGNTLGPRAGTGWEALDASEDTGYGTMIKVLCPATCGTSGGAVYGTDMYSDDSSVCAAAVHAGAIVDDAQGGLITVQLHQGAAAGDLPGSTRNGVTTLSRDEAWARKFSTHVLAESQVHIDTTFGAPAALVESPCGYNDGEFPGTTQFAQPHGIATFRNSTLTDTNFLFVADTGNHVIRYVSATCKHVCENGGICTGPEECTCASGWTGFDCTTPMCNVGVCKGLRNMCVGPNLCECLPGFTNWPECDEPLCEQNCLNAGVCSAPDTCTCQTGWFDTNCSTPVCSQTCGNAGNCIAPDTCSCVENWQGVDCRTPVCTQTCMNSATCSAPDTCTCEPGWSGHDCSLPVCDQGFLQPLDVLDSTVFGMDRTTVRVSHAAARSWNGVDMGVAEQSGETWLQWMPCDTQGWCDSTNEFDCHQDLRNDSQLLEDPLSGPSWRPITGLHFLYDAVTPDPANPTGQIDGDPDRVSKCQRIEIAINTLTPFPYEHADRDGRLTTPWRRQPPLPYHWDSWAKGPDTVAELLAKVEGWRSQAESTSDRMIALVERRSVNQGVYVCANQGECIAPNTCRCVSGWTGFDCRTPICEQGFFEPAQQAYECSIRSISEWENAEYVHDHPNYYSRYMDHHDNEWGPATRPDQIEEENTYYWDAMGWPATHRHTVPDGNYTFEGWTRLGYWRRNTAIGWTKGKCTVEFYRDCPNDQLKSRDVRTLLTQSLVEDTKAAFRATVKHTDESTFALGRWRVLGGECVDQVRRGCANNGTCVAPNTCECAPGWTGDDCSTPVCEQSCSRPLDEDLGSDNNGFKIYSGGMGNCTLPNICTCEKGWTGDDCTVAVCAQHCAHDGRCTAPDTCTCPRWASTWRDGRLDGGIPLFREETGAAQLTGWTGYDCATPICTQATQFVPNEKDGIVSLGGYGLILQGQEPYNNLFRPDLRSPPYYPYVWSNDFPPLKNYLVDEFREYNAKIWTANGPSMLEYEYRVCRMLGYDVCLAEPDAFPLRPEWNPGDGEVTKNNGRSFQIGCKLDSPRFSANVGGREGTLCGQADWLQGDYDDGRLTRFSADATSYIKSTDDEWAVDFGVYAGEGIYECANFGSCGAPDVCLCPDGYYGFDCSTALCRHIQVDGTIVSCLNGATCASKDLCSCPIVESTLHLEYPGAPQGLTGWNGSDCSIAMCAQGTWDPLCDGVSRGGEGCFRCENGGNCTAPDFCTCPPGWTGHDCGTPVCTLRVDEESIFQLDTGDASKIQAFELDPCQNTKKLLWDGREYGHGNCTAPDTCTCLCLEHAYYEENRWFSLPWADPLKRKLPVGYLYGTANCASGFEGIRDLEGKFRSCHLRIYEPTWWEEYTQLLIGLGGTVLVFGFFGYLYVRRKMRERILLEKAERRRSLDMDDFDDDKIS